jgi:hypothetical protein
MRRLLPWLIVVALAAVLALIFRDGGDPFDGSAGFGSIERAADGGRPQPAGALGGDSDLTRDGAFGAVVVRVVDAEGRPADATLHLLADGEPSRVQAVRGSAQILPAPARLSVVAEAGGRWSEAAHWSASEAGSGEVLLTLAGARSAALAVTVSIAGEGAAAGAHVRVVEGLPNDPWRRMMEGIAFRSDDEDDDEAVPTLVPLPDEPPPDLARADAASRPSAERIARRSLAIETWTADAGGVAMVNGLPAGDWAFEVRAAGCSPEFFEVTLAAAERATREVTLTRSGTVAGRVTGPGGGGVVGAEVGLWPRLESEMPWFDPLEDFLRYGRLPNSIPPELRAVCDGEGRFEIGAARAGDYLVLARSDSLRPATSAQLTVEPRGRTDAGDVRLARGHALEVLVRDPAGEPVAGAAVRWRSGESMVGMMTEAADPLLTGADGRATLEALPSSELTATVEHGSYARAKQTFNFLGGTESLPKSWEVTLRAGAAVSGTVLSAGAPVEGARLRVLPSREDAGALGSLFSEEDSASSAQDGTFRFERLPPGSWRVSVEHEDHARLTTEPIELLEGENAPLVLRLAPGATLVVTVLDEDGVKVEGATVMAQRAEDFQSETGTTDAVGVAVLAHLPSGTWTLMRVDQMENQNPQDLRLDIKFVYVTLADGETKEVQLGGPVERADVSGKLTMGGEPLPKHNVTLIGKGGVRMERSDEQGDYRIAGVELGDYMVSVSTALGGGSSWFGALEVRTPGTQQHDVALPSSAIEVVVLDASTGTPIAGVPVNVRPEDGSSVSGGAFQKSDADGLARFTMLVPGRYLAAAGTLAMPMLGGGESFGSVVVSGIVVASENAGTQRVEARLPQPAQLRVRVAGPDGAYLAGAHVHCLGADGQALNFFSTKGTNAKGVVELGGLPPGSQRFLARHPQLGSREFEVVLTAGELAKHEVTLIGGVQLRVSVTDADGAPLSGVLAVAMDARGKPVFYFTIEESQEVNQAWFSGTPQRVGPLDPGEYVIRLHRPGYAAVDHRVTVTATPAVQDVRLRFAAE